MSIRGYFGKRSLLGVDPAVRVKQAEDEAKAEEAARKKAEDAKRYGSVDEYDAVLRSHCRLDQEG